MALDMYHVCTCVSKADCMCLGAELSFQHGLRLGDQLLLQAISPAHSSVLSGMFDVSVPRGKLPGE